MSTTTVTTGAAGTPLRPSRLIIGGDTYSPWPDHNPYALSGATYPEFAAESIPAGSPLSLKQRLRHCLNSVGLGFVWSRAGEWREARKRRLFVDYLRSRGVTVEGTPIFCGDAPFPEIVLAKGAKCFIGDEARIRKGFKLRVGAGGEFRMGFHSGINATSVEVSEGGSIVLEDYALVGACVKFKDTAYHEAYPGHLGPRPRSILLKRDSWVGSDATIYGGVTLGEYSIIGSDAVIRAGKVPRMHTVIGNGGCFRAETGEMRWELVRLIDISPKFAQWEHERGANTWHRH